ncbi:hypothetical protein EYZ11_010614 [Aspergillus tanneri]|uniref:Uncharacterized protein n=1 Tax=Aspergillus tanneri TaxID=1220188 RepID=A0A4S3J5G7_9EURO|nr:hypothetical protein EYZ11_010614 [Aspergillus tanneri]
MSFYRAGNLHVKYWKFGNMLF